MTRKTKIYIKSIVLTLAVGALSAFVTRGNMDVYESINRPSIAPPGFIFPIVWTVLFVLMGISFANVLVKGRGRECSGIYVLQLFANFLWSVIFFNFRAYMFSFVWLILLWVLILVMIKCFYRISPFSAYINVPYFLWVTFAGVLNFMIYILN